MTEPSAPHLIQRQVAQNVVRIRKARGLNQRELAALLEKYGRPMLATVISKIERGDRRIDVDDLVAFAESLGVTPESLLRPFECQTCHGEPPAGFACRTCGAGSG